MLVTDDAVLKDIRFTNDVDLEIKLAGIAAWERLTHRLAAKGFKITGEKASAQRAADPDWQRLQAAQ